MIYRQHSGMLLWVHASEIQTQEEFGVHWCHLTQKQVSLVCNLCLKHEKRNKTKRRFFFFNQKVMEQQEIKIQPYKFLVACYFNSQNGMLFTVSTFCMAENNRINFLLRGTENVFQEH